MVSLVEYYHYKVTVETERLRVERKLRALDRFHYPPEPCDKCGRPTLGIWCAVCGKTITKGDK